MIDAFNANARERRKPGGMRGTAYVWSLNFNLEQVAFWFFSCVILSKIRPNGELILFYIACYKIHCCYLGKNKVDQLFLITRMILKSTKLKF